MLVYPRHKRRARGKQPGSLGHQRHILRNDVIFFILCLAFRMVLSEGVLGIRRREYELERQAAVHELDSSRGQLAYLSTLVEEG